MKLTKILSLILALIMCASAFATVSVFADGEPESSGGGSGESTPTVEFIHAENFNNMFVPTPNQAKTAGILPINGYQNASKVENGVYNLKSNNGRGDLDFQLWTVSDIGGIDKDFTLSLNFKLIGEWKGSVTYFWGIRNRTPDSAWCYPFVLDTNGKLVMTTDEGTVTSEADLFSDFVTLDVAFTKNENTTEEREVEGVPTTVTIYNWTLACYIDGELLGTKSISDANINKINHFRIFVAEKTGQGVALDSFAFAKGAQTLYGVTIPDSEPVYLAPPVPAAPAVTDAEKVTMKYHFAENFEGIDQLNVSNAAADMRNSSGLWLNTDNQNQNNTHTKYTLTEDGTLNWNGCMFLDFHFWQISKYRVKEDFIISTKFKPISENINGRLLGDMRAGSSGAYYRIGVNINNGCLVVGDDNYGLLPLNEWTLIEIAFHYDENAGDGGLFTSFSIIVNGNKNDKSYELPVEQEFSQLKQFRLLDGMGASKFEIDDLCVISGSTSMLYANAPVPRTAKVATSEGDTTDGTEENNGENGGSSSAADNAVNEYTPPAPKPKAEAEAEVEERGCGSSISVGAIALISAIGVAGVAVIRKKED